MYFVSAVLRDAQERYPEIQKLLLGVLLASRKLQHYFEAHRITVVTAYSLERVLRNRSATSRVAEWAFTTFCEELGVRLCFASVAHPRSNGQAE